LLAQASLEFNQSPDKPILIEQWVQGLDLGGRKFTFEEHEYQVDMLKENATRQCFKKGAQVGATEVNVLKTLHGLLFGRYPQGVLYLFPTVNDVTDFSKGRFGPLVSDNEEVASQVSHTDAVGVKRIRKSMLYLRGARATGRIEGIKKTSSSLKGIPVDRLVCDEVDEMEQAMIDLAIERLGHSLVKEEAYLSTPSIPDFGISKLYDESDQRVREIKCSHCNTGTVLELEFPSCLIELSDGRVIRACKKCKREIFLRDGQWVPICPGRSKDLVGWWISQLLTSA
jgi:phage terminase large subunit GpA-like protein